MSSESTIAVTPEEQERTFLPDVVFPAGNSDFRAIRNRCARACREFNNTPDDADPAERCQKWLNIVRPDRDRAEDGALAVTHDQTFANPALKAKTPFVKPPVYIDYGVRLHVGGSTFINRNCHIMDTPVADVVIGEGCNIGPNCIIVGVTHPVRLDERLEKHSIGQPVTIGNDVWIGANVTICGGVTIGDGAVIGACSLVQHNVPPMTVAFGAPARVRTLFRDVKPAVPRAAAVVMTLAEAMALGNRLPLRRGGSSADADGCSGHSQGRQREQEGGDEDGDERDGEDREEVEERYFDSPQSPPPLLPLQSRSRSLFSVGSTLTREVEMGSEGEEVRSLLRRGRGRRRRQQCWVRRFEVEAVVATAVIIALLMAFFFAGVYLGASRSPVSGHH